MAIVGDAYVVVHAMTQGFKDEIEKALNEIDPIIKRKGADMGRAFANNFKNNNRDMFGNFGREAEYARQAFNKLIKTGYALGPMIAGTVSAIADLVSGLFAIGSAVGAAAPALLSFGGIITSLAQGLIATKVAMGGVGKAVQAILADADASGKGQEKRTSAGLKAAKRAVRDAKQRLAELYETIAKKTTEANDRITDSQQALNQAYIDGAESIRQLRFEAEGAAYAQDRAAIQLERARENLMRMQDLPADSRARREAELAYKEADLNYRLATDREAKLIEQVDYANKTGVDGTREVIDAKRDLYEAEQDLFELIKESNRDIAKGNQDVADALARVADAKAGLNGTGQSIQKVQDAMKDLSPEARQFARYIASLKDEMLQLRAAAGRELFPRLTEAIQNLVDRLLPRLIPIFEKTGKVVGDIAIRFSEMLTSSRNLGILDRIFGESNLRILRRIGFAFVNIFEGLLNILDAARPLAETFADFLQNLSMVFRINQQVANSTGQLSDKLSRAGEISSLLGSLVKETWLAFKELGKTAVDAGVKILKYFTEGATKLREFAEAGRKSGELQAYFDRVADNFIAISSLLGKIIAGLFALGGNPGVKQFVDALQPLVPVLTQVGYTLTSTGPLLAEFAVQFARVIQAFTETGGIEMFFKILTQAAKILANVFSNPIVAQVFLFLAAVKGVTLAIGTLMTVSKFAFKVLMGNLLLLPGKAFAAAGGMQVLSASAVLSAGSIGAAAERLRIFNMTAGAGALTGLKTFFAGLKANVVMLKFFGIELLKSYITMIKNIFSMKTFGMVAKGMGKALIAPIAGLKNLVVGMRAVGAAALANPVGAVIIGITLAIVGLILIFKKAYDASKPLQQAVASFANAVKGAFADGMAKINDAIKGIMPGVENLGDLFKKIGDVLAKYVMPIVQKVVVGAMGKAFEYIVYLIDAIKLGLEILLFPFKLVYNIVQAIRTGQIEPLQQIWNDFISIVVKGVNLLISAFNLLPFPDIQPLAEDLGQFTIESDKASKSQDKQNKAMEKAKKVYEEQRKKARELYEEYGSLTEIIDKINGALETEFERLTATARAAIDNIKNKKELKDANKEFTESLKGLKAGTLESDAALAEFAATYLDAAENAIAAGESQDKVKGIIEQGRKAFLDGAADLGIMGDKAKALADKLGLSPNVITKTFKANGLGDMRAMAEELERLNVAIGGSKSPNAIDRLIERKITIEATLNDAMKRAFGKGQSDTDPLFVEVTKIRGGKALGGPVSSNQSYLVGEEGPEIFSPNTNGTIIPNDRLGSALSSASTVINVSPAPGMNERELAKKIAWQLEWSRKRGM